MGRNGVAIADDQRFFFGTVTAKWCHCVGLIWRDPTALAQTVWQVRYIAQKKNPADDPLSPLSKLKNPCHE
jgi:hypothetical protein